jgi:hypothetical protein
MRIPIALVRIDALWDLAREEPRMSADTRSPVRRVNVMIAEHQYEQLARAGVNISALIRDLLEDHLSDHVINLSVSKKTYDLYTKVVGSTGATDADIEPLVVDVLKALLAKRLAALESLQKSLGA